MATYVRTDGFVGYRLPDCADGPEGFRKTPAPIPCFFISAEKLERCMPTWAAAWVMFPEAVFRAFSMKAFSNGR